MARQSFYFISGLFQNQNLFPSTLQRIECAQQGVIKQNIWTLCSISRGFHYFTCCLRFFYIIGRLENNEAFSIEDSLLLVNLIFYQFKKRINKFFKSRMFLIAPASQLSVKFITMSTIVSS